MNDQGRRPPSNSRSHLTDADFTWQDDWVRPQPAPQPGPEEDAPRGESAAPQYTPSQRRAAARRVRARRRKRRQLMFGATAGGVLLLSGIITLLLPKSVTAPGSTVPAETPPTGLLVAPLPYAGGSTPSADGGGDTIAPNWGSVGPTLQTADTGYRYTALTAEDVTTLPEFGRVDTSWFADAAFLGDSLTTGFCAAEYDIDVGGALICAYTGASPNTIVNRTTVNSPDRGEEVPLDVLAAAQPAKLFLLIGTNALVGEGNDESFLNYYARMLDDLRTALPNTSFFVQSILPVTDEALDNAPGLNAARLGSINAAIRALCAERGIYFLDLNAEFSDENGALLADYAQPDGIHLTVPGYNKWVSYLCTHLPYNKNNPYQAGSTYYLDDNLKALLADLP